MNDNPQYTRDDAEDALEELRQQLTQDDAELRLDESTLSAGVLVVLDRGRLHPTATEAVEDALSVDNVDTAKRERFLSVAEAALEKRRKRTGILEVLLSDTRQRLGKSRNDVAEAVPSLSSADVSAIEHGEKPLTSIDAELVAHWIAFLELDNGEAVSALERSLRVTSAATEFRGGQPELSDEAKEFIALVLHGLNLDEQ